MRCCDSCGGGRVEVAVCCGKSWQGPSPFIHVSCCAAEEQDHRKRVTAIKHGSTVSPSQDKSRPLPIRLAETCFGPQASLTSCEVNGKLSEHDDVEYGRMHHHNVSPQGQKKKVARFRCQPHSRSRRARVSRGHLRRNSTCILIKSNALSPCRQTPENIESGDLRPTLD